MPAPDVHKTPDAPLPSGGRRLAAVDGLRGLAALTVFVYHAWMYARPGEPDASDRDGVLDYAVHELRLGLVLFFVLSGFLLFRPWLKAALGDGPRPDLAGYVRARGARILPAYYAVLVACVVLLWGLGDSPGVRLPPAGELPRFLVFGQNLSPASVMKLDPPMWSLCVEVTFYAALPLVGLLIARLPARRAWQAVVPTAFVVGGVAYNWAIAGSGLGLPYTKSLPAMAAYFGVGMLAALAVHGRPASRIPHRALLLGGLAIVAADAFAKSADPAGLVDVGQTFVIIRDLPSAVGFSMVVVAAARATRAPLLASRPFAALGEISYGLYLWHVPVLVFLRGHGLLPLDPVLGGLVAIVPALLIARASWVLLERPAISWAAERNRAKRRARRSDRGGVGRARGGEVAVRAY